MNLLALALMTLPLVQAAPFTGQPELPSITVFRKHLRPPTPAMRRKPARRKAQEATPRRVQVRVDVYTYSDGSFNVYEPFDTRTDIRGYKPFRDDYEYRLNGRVGDQMMSGDARPKFRSDPAMGYNLSGVGFYANLDKFGRDWILRGYFDRKDPGQATRRESFSWRLRRGFSDQYEVFEPGVDLRLELRSFNAAIYGSFETPTIAPMPVALLGTVAGILAQPKLRENPPRP